MVYRYYIDPDVNTVFFHHYGIFEHEESFTALKAVIGDPNHKPGMNIFRDTTQTELPAEHSYQWFKANAIKHSKPIGVKLGYCKFAWVAGSAKDYATAHRWAISSRLQARVERAAFRHVDKARAWIGLPDDYNITFPEEVTIGDE